jgi:hypothetical protein
MFVPIFERVIVGFDVVATNLYHTSRVTEVTHEGEGSPAVFVALTNVPATFEHVPETDNRVALVQSSLDGCAIITPEIKMKKSRKEVWYNGFCIDKDLYKLKNYKK